jgi:glucose-6-phosphate dehydrogenase assembly protein OpcA
MAGFVATTWRQSSPDGIDADLATLWREAGQEGPVSRALMSNLVVVSPHRSFPPVEELARKHPARTILLSYTAGAEEAAHPEGIRIGLLTFGDGGVRYGLEMIAVHAECADRSLPSIVGRLAIGNVPTSVWWAGDLSEPTPPSAIATLGRQLVYDSALWQDMKSGVATAAAVLEHRTPPDLVDLNWRRLAPLRRGLVHALGRKPSTSGAGVSTLRIVHAQRERAAAALLAGWLAAPEHGIKATPEVQPGKDEYLVSVSLGGDAWSITASMTEHHVVVKSNDPDFTMAVPKESQADAIAAELMSFAPDRGLRDALMALSAQPFAGLL